MTQKRLTEALVDKLLQTIDPSEIADESLRQTINITEPSRAINSK